MRSTFCVSRLVTSNVTLCIFNLLQGVTAVSQVTTGLHVGDAVPQVAWYGLAAHVQMFLEALFDTPRLTATTEMVKLFHCSFC